MSWSVSEIFPHEYRYLNLPLIGILLIILRKGVLDTGISRRNPYGAHR
jgi:hypothetical protein